MTTDTKAPGGASLVINRAKWLRGEGCTTSKLLRVRDGKMCCLGMFGLSLGLTPDDISNVGAPDLVPRLWPTWLYQKGACKSTQEAYDLMRVNDDEDLPADVRERQVAEFFAKHGVTVTFIDDEASGTATEGSP